MALAKRRKATLLVAKLDWLSRIVAFIASLRIVRASISPLPTCEPADRGIKLGDPEPAKINRAKAVAQAQVAAPARRAVRSQPISTRAASRHRMVAGGFRCRLAALPEATEAN